MKKIYLVGIGGISMSALAKLFLAKNWLVAGSDIAENNEVKELKKRGVKIFLKQDEKNISSDIDVLVFTSAANNPSAPGFKEIQKARELKILVFKRSEIIGQLMKNYFGISIAGTHGKTTTTAMLGYVLKRLSQQPIVMLGGEADFFSDQNIEIPQNLKKAHFFVSEACEYDGSFLDFQQKIIICLNIEAEHLDYFNTFKDMIKTFNCFFKKLKKDDLIIAYDAPSVRKGLQNIKARVVLYSEKDIPRDMRLKIPGQHNLLNAAAVLKTIKTLNLPIKRAQKILKEYSGVKRRQEFLGEKEGVRFFDDYAHHPTEIRLTLLAFKEKYPRKKILVIFQPHLYERLGDFFQDFVKSLSLADGKIVFPVYQPIGRSRVKKKITSQDLYRALKKANLKPKKLKKPAQNDIWFFKTPTALIGFLKREFKNWDIIISMGAGPIDIILRRFLQGIECKKGI